MELQTAKMLKMLKKAGNRGIENHVFPRHGMLRYSSVISDLRDAGYVITVERKYLKNGRASNVYIYRLVEEKKTPWWNLARV